MSSLRNLLAEDDAALYPYFYEDLDPGSKRARSSPTTPNAGTLDLACEAIVDFADVCVEQRKSIPDADMDWSTWDAYFRFLYQNSPVLRRFLRDSKDFYPDYLTTVFGYILVRDEQTGTVASEWQVKESEQGLKGYPWMRTWVITEIGGCASKGKDKETHTKAKTLEAEVVHLDDHESAIDVQFTWRNVDVKEKQEIETVLYSWVLTQLKSCSPWRIANILDGSRNSRHALLGPMTWRRRLWRFIVRVPTRLFTAVFGTPLPGREPFLAPVVRISSR
jgi:hypothetical protein